MAAAQRPRSPISILLPANDRPSPPWGITGASSNQAYSQMITKLKSIEPPLTLLGNRAFLALALSLSFCILTHHEIAFPRSSAHANRSQMPPICLPVLSLSVSTFAIEILREIRLSADHVFLSHSHPMSVSSVFLPLPASVPRRRETRRDVALLLNEHSG